jgi:hypothetical protein
MIRAAVAIAAQRPLPPLEIRTVIFTAEESSIARLFSK